MNRQDIEKKLTGLYLAKERWIGNLDEIAKPKYIKTYCLCNINILKKYNGWRTFYKRKDFK